MSAPRTQKSGDVMPIGQAPEVNEEAREKARRTVANCAARTGGDKWDLAEALGALGLLPGQEDEW